MTKDNTKCSHIALEKLVQRNDSQKELNAVYIHSKRKLSPLDFKKLKIQKRESRSYAINTQTLLSIFQFFLFSLNFPTLFLLTKGESVGSRFK